MIHCISILLTIVLSAQIDSSTIMLGDQTDLHLSATMDKGETVTFPQYDKTLIDAVEIVDKTIVDTNTLDDGRVQLHQYLTLTAFKDSLFYIPPIAFTIGDDTLYTPNSLSLNVVQPFEIDTTEVLTDIKGIYSAPIWWWGIIRWILLGLLLCGIGFLVWYLVRRYYHPREAQAVINPELFRPADEVALEKLDAIKVAKIWQQGQNKEYHTQLTDVLREYIRRRFEIVTFERTSDEVLKDMKGKDIEPDLFAKMKSLFQMSDLVKFAKWQTTPSENESVLSDAYMFVHETKPVVVEPTAQEQEEEEVL